METTVQNPLSSLKASSRRTALACLSAGAALVLAAALTGLPAGEARAQAPLKPDVDVAELMKSGDLPDNVMGNADAPYTIIEYSSMTCPHCAAFHTNVLPELKKKYIDTGKAKYIIREFPLDNVAAAAFMLARCVDQAKYFDFVDLLYANQKEWAFENNPLPALQKFSKQVGFTEQRFNDCLKDEKLLNHIESVRNRGSEQFGVRATPTFFINGQKLKGVDIEDFDKVMGGSDGKS
ncbi:MAG: DsbA family protein [Rhodomicrobium sp.]|nr:DsbA family protein [Rhodomicrobium sp.]